MDNKVKEIRKENMAKILKTIEIKNNIRDQEIKEADQQEAPSENLVEKKDTFFLNNLSEN